MTRYLSAKDFGAFSIKEGKLKVYRKSGDASQRIRQRKSKRVKVISPKVAARLQRP